MLLSIMEAVHVVLQFEPYHTSRVFACWWHPCFVTCKIRLECCSQTDAVIKAVAKT